MFTLPTVLIAFLPQLFTFSLVYCLIDNHSKTHSYSDFFQNMKLYLTGFIGCALLLNVLQGIFGQ